ncbi:MAG TPA: dihydrofolate reductase family protein [Streptosporangiaceae bacterium]|jgi:dihydrofolate reductase
MARLIYSAIASADGFVEDADGGFDWGAPGPELLSFINELERPAGTYLYGRRMYETMRYWETADQQPGQSPYERDFTRLWQAASKIVFSATMTSVSTARTRLERAFVPDDIMQLKQDARQDLSIGGADLAGQALKAGLVDELRLFLVPVIVGAGKPALPAGVRLDLELLDIRKFTSGAVYLSYRPGLAGPKPRTLTPEP